MFSEMSCPANKNPVEQIIDPGFRVLVEHPDSALESLAEMNAGYFSGRVD